jgi:hypothetical protein
VLGRDSDGVDVAYAAGAPDRGAPEVRIDADMGIGALQVRRGDDAGDLGFDRGHRWFDTPVQPACP